MVERLPEIPYAEHDIVMLSVQFDEGNASKYRPAYIIKLDGEEVLFYKVTSQYEKKSEAIQEKYFEIVDWVEAGLKKRSWIDTVSVRSVNEKETRISFAGIMSAKDKERLAEFLENIVDE